MSDYQCCICKETVTSDVASPLDPCSLILVSNIDRPRDDQKEQEFFCHLDCFRQLINNDGLMYIMEPNATTMGELNPDEDDWSEDEGHTEKATEADSL